MVGTAEKNAIAMLEPVSPQALGESLDEYLCFGKGEVAQWMVGVEELGRFTGSRRCG
jgi:hypothetical protein